VEASIVDGADVTSSDCPAMSWLAHQVLSWYGGWLKNDRLRLAVPL
jgi:hypothetical protein